MKALYILNLAFDESNFQSLRGEINEAIAELEALQAPKRCYECKDKYECHTYHTLDEDATYILSCSSYEPKDKQ